MFYSLDFVVDSTGGIVNSRPVSSFVGFATDNRDPEIKGKLFVPLVGDNHDGHRFVKAAVEAGAAGVIYHKWDSDWDDLKSKATFIVVEDTLRALQDFAKEWRHTFTGKVLALTGSNGKTTTKDFLYQILQNFGTVNASVGSYNNHWGVPFTLLWSDPTNDYCVVEMGMNHGGEIVRLMSIADPDLVTVTNVGRAHMGNFENGIEGVAAAKEEIYEMAKASCQLLFNLDNKWTQEMFNKYMDRASYTYSTQNFSADVYFRIKERTATGVIIEGQIGGVLGKQELRLWGDHNIENLAAAVALAYIGGVRPEKIWSVLKDCHTGWGRNQWIDTEKGLRILFDGYNANPDSFAALLNNVEPLLKEKKSIALFGEMLELGDQAGEQHYELGKSASQLQWQHCFFVGTSAEEFEKGWCESGNKDQLTIAKNFADLSAAELARKAENCEVLVIKGSRGGALERAIPPLKPLNWLAKYDWKYQ